MSGSTGALGVWQADRDFPRNPGSSPLTWLFITIIQILDYLLSAYLFVLFANAIVRLVRADPSNGIVRFLSALADPPARALLRKFPKLLLRNGPDLMDLSPLVLMLGIGALKIVLGNLQTYLGTML